MKALKTSVIVVVGLAVVLFGVGLLLPSHWQVQRSIVVNAPPGALLPLVANFKTGWGQWSAFDGEAADIQYSYSGPDEGPGAARSWTSKRMGDGTQKILRADARGVTFELRMAQNGFTLQGVIAFDPAPPAGTRVTWTDAGELGINPLYRYMGTFMDRLMGGTFEKSLAALKQKVEAPAKP